MSGAGAFWDFFSGLVRSARGNPFLAATLDSIITLIIAGLVSKIFGYMLRRMAEKNIITTPVSERLSRLFSIIVYGVAGLFIIYFYVGVGQILYVLIVLALIFLVYAWEPMSNVMSYYAIVLSRLVSPGDYVFIDGVSGRIRDIGKLSVTIRTPNGDLVSIPNRTILSRVLRKMSDLSTASIIVHVDNYEDPDKLEEIEKKIREIIVLRYKHGIMTVEPTVSLISANRHRATYMVTVSLTGYEPRIPHLSNLVKLLTTELSRDYEVSVEIPHVKTLKPSDLR
jgi:small-conductance mechanosensitive channel